MRHGEFCFPMNRISTSWYFPSPLIVVARETLTEYALKTIYYSNGLVSVSAKLTVSPDVMILS